MRSIKGVLGFGIVSFLFISSSFALPSDIPVNPDLTLTPGDICEKGETNQYRYAERIPYCTRSVGSETKDNVFERYSQKYGLAAKGYTRRSFKIDHFISLCMGGSNDPSNLWPQHMKVAELTDQIEDLLCRHMNLGKMKQAEAVDTIRKVKLNLKLAAPTLERLRRDLGLEATEPL